MKQILFSVFTLSALALGVCAQDAAAKAQPKPSYQVLDVYPLATCVVSGKTLDAKKATVVQAGGMTFRVCSADCAKKVTAAPEEFGKKLETAKIAAQAPFYPLANCPISNEKLEEGKGKHVLIDGTLVHFCCAKCVAKAQDQKSEVTAKVRDAAYAAQAKSWSLEKCPVSGDELKKGDTVDVLVGNRLVRLCCEDCVKDLQEDPAKVLAKMPAPTGKGALKEGAGACCAEGEKKAGGCCSEAQKAEATKKDGPCCDEKKEGGAAKKTGDPK